MKTFEKQKLNRKDHKVIDNLATICRVIITPVAFVYANYIWTWDVISNRLEEKKFR